jgi:endonuclease/exonuclease/phosphatase family metal-dependent hydrolase
MKLHFALLPVVLLPLAALQPAGESAAVVVRVLTYNIRHGEGRDGRVDLERIAEVIRRVQPDIIALQEVDRGTARSGGVDQVSELAQRLEMHAAFGAAMFHDGGSYGVAILSRWPIHDIESHPLPFTPDNEPRTALSVLLRAGDDGPLLRFVSTHLDQSRDTDDRPAQVSYLNRVLAVQDGVPTILAGDFNLRADSSLIRVLEGVWTNAAAGTASLAGTASAQAPTSTPAAGPSQGSQTTLGPGRGRGGRSDWVLIRPDTRWRVIEATVIDETTASDHRPVLAVLEWLGVP